MAQPQRFSGAVMLGDLNDFIAPALACVKPIESKPLAPANAQANVASINFDSDGVAVEVNRDGSQKRLEPTKISLNDCLACSGCVTSAETVLVQAQSDAEVLRVVSENAHAIEDGHPETARTIVVSVSPQTRASFAAKYGLSIVQVARRLTTFFKEVVGARAVFDTSFSRDIVLAESAAEFVSRFRSKASVPILASSCPGWICFAEKRYTNSLPYISTCKSPMQVMGTLVKEKYGSSIGLTPDKVYHVSLMPCFDKKLEASRQDFYNEAYRTKDVDCVLTTTEVEKMMADRGTTILDWAESELDEEMTKMRKAEDGQVELLGSEGTGAGGVLEYVFRHAAKELFGVTPSELTFKVGRNADFKELKLEVDGKVVLQFAHAYGLRNIQNLSNMFKTGRISQYHFIEVMACPSACLNGGGQLKQESGQPLDKAMFAQLEAVYHSAAHSIPDENAAINGIYDRFGAKPYDDKARAKFHTGYHSLASNAPAGIAVQW